MIMAMYMKPAPARRPLRRASGSAPAALGAVALAVAAVLLFGFWPGGVLDLAGADAGDAHADGPADRRTVSAAAGGVDP